MLLCVLCWSSSGLVIKYIDWPPMVISGIRSGIAALVMLAVGGRNMFRVFRLPAAAGGLVLPVVLAAAFASAGTKMLYVLANKLTTAANAIFLQHSAPVWAAFLGWFFCGERPKKGQWAALALVCAGLVLFFVNGLSRGSLAGDGAALAAGVCFGAGMVFLRMNRRGSPELCLFLSHCIPLAAGLPFIIARPPKPDAAAIGAVLFLGIVQVGAASLLYARAIRRLRAVDAAFISQLEPVLNPIWVFAFTGEAPAPLSVAGGLIIIAAVAVNTALARKSRIGPD